MPRVSEVFSPSLTKVPSTSLGCGLAVKQVAYARERVLLPALSFNSIIGQRELSMVFPYAVRIDMFRSVLAVSSKKCVK